MSSAKTNEKEGLDDTDMTLGLITTDSLKSGEIKHELLMLQRPEHKGLPSRNIRIKGECKLTIRQK